MKVLFIGGTGLISKAVTNLCINKGIDLTLFNRGNNNKIFPKGVKFITGNINNEEEVKKLLEGYHFDVVVDWIAFTVDQVERDYRLFKGKTTQYIFISSASAYKKPVTDFPITENTPLDNPYWEYSQNKINCEHFLNKVNSSDFNVTIIRPSHTYDDNSLMLTVNEWGSEYTVLKRIMEGKKYIIPGDGTSLWTITHNTDFALGFVPVLGNSKTYGEVYHITSDHIYTWEQLYEIQCKALGVKPNPIYIPTDFILKHMPHKRGEFLGDKHWSVFFDNSKIKEVSNFNAKVRYEDVVNKAMKTYLENHNMQEFDNDFNNTYDKIISNFEDKVRAK